MAWEPSIILDIEDVVESNDIEALIDGEIVSWRWPDEIGCGTMGSVNIRDGLTLGWGDFQVFENIVLNDPVSYLFLDMPLVFRFFPLCYGSFSYQCLSRHCKYNLGDSGFGSLLYPGQGVEEQYRFICQRPIRCVSLSVAPSLLKPFIKGHHDSFSAGLCDVVAGDREHSFNQVFTLSHEIHQIINQLMDCPYHGAFKQFFFEAKALELLTCTMSQLAKAENISVHSGFLTPEDNTRVGRIREQLLNSLDKPPSLATLAKSTGTNKDKLNKDFRRAFGTSVFDFFRVARLEQAKRLLEEKKMNVTEVAFEMGYSQPQNFTRAFKNHFGSSPSDYLY